MEMKKTGVFVGVLFVGVLMLSLVAGAGYNVVVPSVDPPADPVSPGGGGGGGGIVANVTDNETVSGDAVVEGNVSVDDGVSDSDVPFVDVEKVIEVAKSLWVWVSAGAILAVVALVIYFKKFRKF